MFDPFGDFETAGYLRNTQRLKDLRIVKQIEHEVFRANLIDAIEYLAKARVIGYSHFLKVHEILFSDFYPWAGKGRAEVAPSIAVSKATVMFGHPMEAERAVSHGLQIGQSKAMRRSLGEVMGLFAYGHPFLDGNGRTMLVVHSELCYRAGFSVNWGMTAKADYLAALSSEIDRPKDHALDSYLSKFIGPKIPRDRWFEAITAINGLDGARSTDAIQDMVVGDYSDEEIAARYREHEARRGYVISSKPHPDTDG